ncbi:hypothetical protein PPERSA_06933 [Pseudocohnilembus persalinus]|uniref:SET domain-containing protein n=1 Tax=Pseudocohnilembus persalinus TaxID=266149 RepID=A0A0V0QYI1_PSEPJ|nr:hypothetical protein PPERSA_06933 [Pseudocohnilembus persalinus]|eukprot:KRX07318.1 hypothetical protein PPERSA_06933 [Pseudocohnilembus persalinus]
MEVENTDQLQKNTQNIQNSNFPQQNTNNYLDNFKATRSFKDQQFQQEVQDYCVEKLQFYDVIKCQVYRGQKDIGKSVQSKDEVIQNEKQAFLIKGDEKQKIIYTHEKHMLNYLASQVIEQFGPSLSAMQVFSLVINKEPQQGRNLVPNISITSRKIADEYNQQQIQYGQIFRCKNKHSCPLINNEIAQEVILKVDNFFRINPNFNEIEYFKKQLKIKKYQYKYVEQSWLMKIGSQCFISYSFDGSLSCKQVYEILYVFKVQNENRHSQMEVEEQDQELEDEELEDLQKQNEIQKEERLQKQKKQDNQTIKKNTQNYSQSRDRLQQKYNPCWHEGPCEAKNFCICVILRGKCEKFCMCSQNCKIRFKGCSCQGGCNISDPSKNNSNQKCCPCFLDGRECDPDLCSCPSYINKAKVIQSKQSIPYCDNTSILYQYKPRLILQKSHICDGLGVVAGQNFGSFEFVGEYVGEILSKDESYYRDIIYLKKDIHYYFDLGYDTDMLIDPYPYGNKVRFLNYLNQPDLENCMVKYVFVNGMTRIALFTTKQIQKGQELFFNYGEGYEVEWKKTFDQECLQWQMMQKEDTLEQQKKKAIEVSKQKLNKTQNKQRKLANIGRAWNNDQKQLSFKNIKQEIVEDIKTKRRRKKKEFINLESDDDVQIVNPQQDNDDGLEMQFFN